MDTDDLIVSCIWGFVLFNLKSHIFEFVFHDLMNFHLAFKKAESDSELLGWLRKVMPSRHSQSGEQAIKAEAGSLLQAAATLAMLLFISLKALNVIRAERDLESECVSTALSMVIPQAWT